jgi:hypothetical protein
LTAALGFESFVTQLRGNCGIGTEAGNRLGPISHGRGEAVTWWLWLIVGIGVLSVTLIVVLWASFTAGARSDRLLG